MDLKEKLRIFNAKHTILAHRLEEFGIGLPEEAFNSVLEVHIEIMKQALSMQEENFKKFREFRKGASQ